MSSENENIIEQLAESREALESIEGMIAELPDKIKPDNEEIHKLLTNLIEEFKKPCHITLKLK